MMIVIETDHNAYTEDTKSQRKIQMAEEMREAAGEDEQVRHSIKKLWGALYPCVVRTTLNSCTGKFSFNKETITDCIQLKNNLF